MGGSVKSIGKKALGITRAEKDIGSTVKTIKNPKRALYKEPVTEFLDEKWGNRMGIGIHALVDPKTVKKEGGVGSYGGDISLSEAEKRAGANLQFEQLRDPSTGKLRQEFQLDPTKSEAFLKLREQAMAAPGQSPWAKMQMEKQAMEESGGRDLAAKQQAQAMGQAQASLMRFGGMGGGARTSMARAGARDLMSAQQDVARQGMLARLGIGEQDIARQQDALGKVSATELDAQGRNIAQMTGDVQAKRDFDLERYKQQMAAYGASRSARAQEVSAQKSGKK